MLSLIMLTRVENHTKNLSLVLAIAFEQFQQVDNLMKLALFRIPNFQLLPTILTISVYILVLLCGNLQLNQNNQFLILKFLHAKRSFNFLLVIFFAARFLVLLNLSSMFTWVDSNVLLMKTLFSLIFTHRQPRIGVIMARKFFFCSPKNNTWNTSLGRIERILRPFKLNDPWLISINIQFSLSHVRKKFYFGLSCENDVEIKQKKSILWSLVCAKSFVR